jgi:hypothetical protein
MCEGVAGLHLAAIAAFLCSFPALKGREFRHQPKNCQGFQKYLALRS